MVRISLALKRFFFKCSSCTVKDLLKQLLVKMIFFVVQWDGEDSVRIIRKAQLAHSGDEDITQGMTVQVLSSKNSKGRSIFRIKGPF